MIENDLNQNYEYCQSNLGAEYNIDIYTCSTESKNVYIHTSQNHSCNRAKMYYIVRRFMTSLARSLLSSPTNLTLEFLLQSFRLRDSTNVDGRNMYTVHP